MEIIKNKLAERLASLRKQHNISQYKLAEILGFSRGLIANYEQGRREPDYNTLLIFASFYQVSIDYLLGRTEHKNADYNKLNLDIELINSINKLSLESKNDLIKYINLLTIRDNLELDKKKQK